MRVNQVICSLDYGNVSCSSSENLLSKLNQKCYVSMLTFLVSFIAKFTSKKPEKKIIFQTSFYCLKRFKNILNKSVESPSCQRSIRNLKKLFPPEFTISNRDSYMNLLHITCKNYEWRYLVVKYWLLGAYFISVNVLFFLFSLFICEVYY